MTMLIVLQVFHLQHHLPKIKKSSEFQTMTCITSIGNGLHNASLYSSNRKRKRVWHTLHVYALGSITLFSSLQLPPPPQKIKPGYEARMGKDGYTHLPLGPFSEDRGDQ